MTGPCPACDRFDALIRALRADDLDAAIELGLLHCDGSGACHDRDQAAVVFAARDERLRALSARERYRARTARLTRRAEAAAARRSPVAVADITGPGDAPPDPGLPPAAAAALARALARARSQ
ncbi:MAG TPA: hypothetical protein VNI56_03240 [Xanthomonadaceae bacterium]|nr:hypothetical protein [Xanthomonadaceae bacterium]